MPSLRPIALIGLLPALVLSGCQSDRADQAVSPRRSCDAAMASDAFRALAPDGAYVATEGKSCTVAGRIGPPMLMSTETELSFDRRAFEELQRAGSQFSAPERVGSLSLYWFLQTARPTDSSLKVPLEAHAFLLRSDGSGYVLVGSGPNRAQAEQRTRAFARAVADAEGEQ